VITTLRFNSENEDDMHRLKLIGKADAMHSVLHDVAQELRKKTKYGFHSEDYTMACHDMSEMFWNYCKEHEVDPFE
jgi:hypothetical protein